LETLQHESNMCLKEKGMTTENGAMTMIAETLAVKIERTDFHMLDETNVNDSKNILKNWNLGDK